MWLTWLGTNLNIFYIVNGVIVVGLGLSFTQALLAIAAGNLCFFCVGLTSLQGPKTGTSTFVISRAAYGPNGGRGLPCSTGLRASVTRHPASPSLP